jgi:hypothetical protein
LVFCSSNGLKMRDKSIYEKAVAKDDLIALINKDSVVNDALSLWNEVVEGGNK